MKYMILCREDMKVKIEKTNLLEKLSKENYQILNIVTLPLSQWAGKVDDILLVPYESNAAASKISFVSYTTLLQRKEIIKC